MTVHISPERLLATDRTPEEEAHLAECEDCRENVSLYREFRRSSESPLPFLPEEPVKHLPRGTRVEKYEIEEVLGEGGMAVVYRARHVVLGSAHAIKVLTIHARAVSDRLLREGRQQARLRSPYIVPVTDVILVEGAPALVMELVEGPTLARFLRERGRLSFAEVDELALGILDGVAAAHAAELVHRDLKPDNILVTRSGGHLVPKISDFGLVKELEPEEPIAAVDQTRSSALLGTPRFMAPEQIENPAVVDRRADLFSLGAILYELITGQPAFRGATLMAVYGGITAARYQPVRQIVPDAPARMVAAVEAALVVDPARRVQDVERLRAIWVGVATEVPPEPPPRGKGCGRWAALLALLLAVGGGAAAWKLIHVGDGGGGGGPGVRPLDYMPLAVGNWWTYSMLDEYGRPKSDKTIRLDRYATVDGPSGATDAFRLLREDAEGFSYRWIRKEGDRVVWVHDEWMDRNNVLTRSEFFSPFKTRVDNARAHTVPGATWVETYDEISMDVKTGREKLRKKTEATWTVEAVDEEVTVPAGTFACLRLRRVKRGEPDVQIFWFADGVGKIKEDNPPKEFEELREYHLEPAPAP